jgi:acyl-CoA thioesterase
MTDAAPKNDIAELLRARVRRSPLMRELRIEVLEAARGRVVITIDPPENSANGRGYVHGGFLFTICDTAAAFVCIGQTDGGVTQSAHITYVAPAKVGEILRAEAWEAARTRRSQTYDVKVTNPAGETVAIFRGIFQLLPHKPAPPQPA